MKQATFDNSINLEYSDDFKELSVEENKKYFSGDLQRISFYNSENHILLSLSKSNSALLNRLISVTTVLSGALSNLERSLKEYRFIEESDSIICDRPSITAYFSYTASNENAKQYGELSVFKIKSTFYIIYCISRFEDKEESKKIFNEFKNSFHK